MIPYHAHEWVPGAYADGMLCRECRVCGALAGDEPEPLALVPYIAGRRGRRVGCHAETCGARPTYRISGLSPAAFLCDAHAAELRGACGVRAKGQRA